MGREMGITLDRLACPTITRRNAHSADMILLPKCCVETKSEVPHQAENWCVLCVVACDFFLGTHSFSESAYCNVLEIIV